MKYSDIFQTEINLDYNKINVYKNLAEIRNSAYDLSIESEFRDATVELLEIYGTLTRTGNLTNIIFNREVSSLKTSVFHLGSENRSSFTPKLSFLSREFKFGNVGLKMSLTINLGGKKEEV